MSATPKTDARLQAEAIIVLLCQLDRENAALREDKERLDWLEANLYTLWASGLRCNESPAVEIAACSGRFEAEFIRAAIDAARAKEAKTCQCTNGIVRSVGRDNEEIIEDCPNCSPSKETKP